MNRIFRTMTHILLALIALAAVLAVAAFAYLRQPKFAEPLLGDRLAAFAQSPNYTEGEFHNQLPSPLFTGAPQSRIESLWRFVTANDAGLRPDAPIPA